MSYNIKNSQDWPGLETTIYQNLKNATDNPAEIVKIMRNIRQQISELSRMEVDERRRQKPSSRYLDKVDKINQDLLQLEKLVVLATLWR